MKSTHALSTVPDDELLRRLVDLLHHSRRAEADLVAHIGEVDARRLYAREASPSMFAYCTERLHLSDAEAYLRIAAARASREHPVLLDMLADGRLHLTAIAKLAPHLTAGNGEALLQRATHRSKRQIEELVAELAPRPDVPARLPKLPDRRGGSPARIEVRPDPAEDCSLQVRPDGVVGQEVGRPAELRDKLERLRGLMRASVPDGDLAAIIEQAVTEKLERLEARRFARAKVPETAPARPEASPASGRSPRPHPVTSRPRCGAPCTSATRGVAATLTSGDSDAPRARGSSSTIGTRLATAAATPWTGSPFCAGATTVTWPRSTTGGRRSPGIGSRRPDRATFLSESDQGGPARKPDRGQAGPAGSGLARGERAGGRPRLRSPDHTPSASIPNARAARARPPS